MHKKENKEVLFTAAATPGTSHKIPSLTYRIWADINGTEIKAEIIQIGFDSTPICFYFDNLNLNINVKSKTRLDFSGIRTLNQHLGSQIKARNQRRMFQYLAIASSLPVGNNAANTAVRGRPHLGGIGRVRGIVFSTSTNTQLHRLGHAKDMSTWGFKWENARLRSSEFVGG
ncbi:hypothetical protein B0H14DRAFT_2610167 [Mycena olivaceomarginata]|nr:hypothetical protein B0H14DRAFT_2610167 [Mycena olivaceomarginata]